MGLALLWKPRGPGSQDWLGTFKRQLKLPGKSRTGIGHTGTLDPFAEGLLCIGTEEGTKLLAPLMGLPKTYQATLVFGVSSSTLDDTGELVFHENASVSERLKSKAPHDFEAFLATKIGRFDQMPPAFSALHVDGKRAYEWARLGVEKELKSRSCEILRARHMAFGPVTFKDQFLFEWVFEVQVSSGTYIRSLARDWGEELSGRPGLLSKLVRTEVGAFKMPQADGVQWLSPADLGEYFSPRMISESDADGIRRFGRWTPPLRVAAASYKPELLVAPSGDVIAWTEADSGKLGRVFTSDPFKLDSSEDRL